MKIFRSSMLSSSNSTTCRMGITFEKKNEALFLSKYCKCTLRLKDICLIEKGTNITEEKANTDGSIPVVKGGKSYAYFHDAHNREGNIITISASGANAGFVNFWEKPIWASDCTTVRSKDEKIYSTKFIYYLLRIIQDDIYLMQTGTDQPHVYPDDIGTIMIPDIPIENQQNLLDDIKPLEEDIDELLKKIEAKQGEVNSVIETCISSKVKS